MRRFFFNPGAMAGDLVELDHEESHHISKVLRLQVGTEIELIDGRGSLFQAKVTTLGRHVVAQVLAQTEVVQAHKTPLVSLPGGPEREKNGPACAEMHRARGAQFCIIHKQPQPGTIRKRASGKEMCALAQNG